MHIYAVYNTFVFTNAILKNYSFFYSKTKKKKTNSGKQNRLILAHVLAILSGHIMISLQLFPPNLM